MPDDLGPPPAVHPKVTRIGLQLHMSGFDDVISCGDFSWRSDNVITWPGAPPPGHSHKATVVEIWKAVDEATIPLLKALHNPGSNDIQTAKFSFWVDATSGSHTNFYTVEFRDGRVENLKYINRGPIPGLVDDGLLIESVKFSFREIACRYGNWEFSHDFDTR
jgi:type VI protein secretion system component Hcp